MHPTNPPLLSIPPQGSTPPPLPPIATSQNKRVLNPYSALLSVREYVRPKHIPIPLCYTLLDLAPA
ncbi:MAG: hypothetical protein ACK55Z_10610 [bacterium]